MSKDKEPKEPKEQQTIDGAGDKPTPRVVAAARKYAKTLNERMAWSRGGIGIRIRASRNVKVHQTRRRPLPN